MLLCLGSEALRSVTEGRKIVLEYCKMLTYGCNLLTQGSKAAGNLDEALIVLYSRFLQHHAKF